MAKFQLSGGRGLDFSSKIDLRIHRKLVMDAIDSTNRDALKEFASSVAEMAKEIVPEKTGVLKDSIVGRVRKAYGGKPGEYAASVSTNTASKKLKNIGEYRTWTYVDSKGKLRKRGRRRKISKYGYGLDVEVGHADGNYKKTPYLRPAFYASAKKIRETMRAAVEIHASRQRSKAGRAI